MAPFRSILITGTNRGIGLEMVKQLASQVDSPIIFATCRDPSKATELNSLASSNSKIHVLQFEVSDFDSHEGLAAKVDSVVGSDGLDILVNNAGIYRQVLLEKGTHEMMTENFVVNSVAPLFITRAFLPLLRKAKSSIPSPSVPTIVNVSSIAGSIEANNSKQPWAGGHYSYRGSKAALNMVTKSMHVDLASEGIKAIALHPGWVMTDLGGPNAILTVEESVKNCLSTINKTVKGELANNDKIFLSYDGSVIEW